MTQPNQTFLVWVDLEMTGLDPDTDEILEIAVVITDAQLNAVAHMTPLVIKQDPSRFAKMDHWNQEHHTKSGLWARALESTTTLEEAQSRVLGFMKQYCRPKESPLCGNTVWQDRRFLIKHMKEVDTYLHYRIVDVSTIKELAKLWYPELGKQFTKKNAHRALDDIFESIAELKFYRERLFPRQNS
ncbi:MAG: oligoribonuclease [Oligoflexales bacterium]